MKKQNNVNFLTLLLFLGVICTFAIYFGITAIMQGPADIFDFEGKLESAIRNNERLDEKIAEINFRVFRIAEDDNVIVGSGGFLFEHADENGYEYLLDYQGKVAFSEAELAQIKSNIDIKRAAYASVGCEYLLVVIPNSQTVYSENMPFYYGRISENTRLSLLREYLEEHGTDCFLDATDALRAAKSDGLQYNNTENSLNAYGAYTVYSAVIDRLEGILEIPSKIEFDSNDFYSHFDSGRAVARRAGLADIAYNRTVSLANKPDEYYTTQYKHENFMITSFEKENSPTLMLEYSNEWNRIVLQTCFSNTFAKVAYKDGLSFSEYAIFEANPDIVVQILSENELYLLSDPQIQMTYAAALPNVGDENETSVPAVLGYSMIDSDTICIYGEAEPGAEISVKSDVTATAVQRVPNGRFFVNVDVHPSDGEIEFAIVAILDGKKTSEPASFVWKRDGKQTASNSVAIGTNSWLFSTKYSINSEDFNLKDGISTPHVRAIREITGKDTECVLAVVPSKLTVYKNRAPSGLLVTAGKFYRIRQELPRILGDEISVIDLTDFMIGAQSEELYYQTGNKPTDKGSYQIYLGILSSLGIEPSVREEDLVSKKVFMLGGEQISALGLDPVTVYEETEIMSVRDSACTFYAEDGNFRVRNSDDSKPRALILCDEQGALAARFLVEDFGEALIYEVGNFTIDPVDLEELKPDYIIRINGEENLAG